MTRLFAALFALLTVYTIPADAQRGRAEPPASGDTAAVSASPGTLTNPNAAPVVTRHTMTVNGQPLRYTATTGMMPIRDPRTRSTDGHIFYVAYTKDGETNPATRPVTFVFNGGPGSSTVWLHMGAYGPKIVRLDAEGAAGPPPYRYIDNEHTLLDQSDLVFLDPVGTGYSRPTTPADGAKFFGLDEDARAVGEFIRLWLVRNQRWTSPLFVSGESYGTTRAAYLSNWLIDNGIPLNGVILLSAVLNFELSRFDKGNDMAFINFLPSYAVTAWYHKKLPPDLQALSVEEVARRSGEFATTRYATALMRGHGLPAAERDAVAAEAARWTGLTTEYLQRNDLRLTLARFSSELLRDTREYSGRLDSRFKAFAQDGAAVGTDHDPSMSNIRHSYTPVLNDYVRRVLRYENDETYWILGGGIGPWRYPATNSYPNVTGPLEQALAKNPDMKLYLALAYYDMATPFWAAQATLDNLVVSPDVRAGFRTQYFEAGHMMYIHEPSMAQMRSGIRDFITEALPR